MALLPRRNPKNDPRITELNWYDRYGNYPERITKDREGRPFVIGDHCWNLKNPDRPEYIEHLIHQSP